jgi:hypothetical protein
MTLGGPQLEFRVARGSNLQQCIVATVVERDAGDGLRVAAIEILSQAKNRGELFDDLASFPSELAEFRVPTRRRRTPMVACDQRNRFDLVRLEATEIAVLDQVIRVAVVAFVADVYAGIMQDRRIFEPFALLVGHAVD